MHQTFPASFYWGGATAANQFEGGYRSGGKGESVCDHMTAGSRTAPRRYTNVPPFHQLEPHLSQRR